MRSGWLRAVAGGVAGMTAAAASAQQQSVVDSPHNLSAAGPGTIRAAGEDQVCIFCHAPHNATPVRPLWNRVMPVEAYSIYTSRALDALPGQPTGTSKMCLSCHDGTIAIGSVVSRDAPILMRGGVTTMPDGHGLIGTDLRDDHPISFRYDGSLVARDVKLRSPTSLPQELKLDPNSELQCTTCHDAHNNARGSFLVMRNAASEMCLSCHNMGTTTITAHTDCSACHQPHSAPSGPYLLKRATVTQTCNHCHDGTLPTAADIASELRKFVSHDTGSAVDPAGAPAEHSTCTDCHDAHTMSRGAGVSPAVHPNFGRVAGVGLSGSAVTAATSEFEVCFKCHADSSTIQPDVPRKIVQNNTRLEFSTSAVSFHPVAGPGRNPEVPSLKPGWTTASTMYCSSCHQSDTARATGGGGPNGTHGSSIRTLLAARYETFDRTSESAAAYALCYACHDRASILDDASFPSHQKHIVDERTPCSACHDAHGIASFQGNPVNNSNLINFATNIVFPNSAGRLEFRDTGRFRGECFLSCHGREHSPERYEK
ncbi:MAG: hypothetical protein IT436_04770 [Phycisphaerales bacterium]|nr:hypothetical protein [Phycisphaerales bacterium]